MKYNFKDVKNLFEEHRIWCSGKELLWFEGIWDILGKEGLTENAAEAFEDDCPPDDWYSALFCAVSLLKLFHEYFAFGLVCGRAKDLLYSHNLDDAVLIRSDAMREKIVKAILKHMTAAELFFSLFAVTVDLTELVESCEEEYGESGEKDYDDSEEETGKLIETVFEPKTAG